MCITMKFSTYWLIGSVLSIIFAILCFCYIENEFEICRTYPPPDKTCPIEKCCYVTIGDRDDICVRSLEHCGDEFKCYGTTCDRLTFGTNPALRIFSTIFFTVVGVLSYFVYKQELERNQ